MPSPFPGMNPYLENPELWPEVHSRLIVAIADAVAPHIRPKYRVAIEKRVYQMTDENEEVREGYLEVREVGTGEVVTVIEVLSPKNKRLEEGRNAYESKRQQVLGSSSHLVEIDLLRRGQPMPILNTNIQSIYRILLSRSNLRPKAELYPFELQEPIPTFPLPLRRGDTEPIVDLQALIHGVYERAGLDLAIDYTREPVPPLSEVDAEWANELLQQQGLR